MPHYFYSGRAAAGGAVRGVMEAPGLVEAARQLRRDGVVPLRIRPLPALVGRWQRVGAQRRISGRQLSVLFRHLYHMLKSGVPLVTALRLKENDRTTPGLQLLLGRVRREVEGGNSFSAALRTTNIGISPVMLEMIAGGEAGGYLETVLERLAEQTEKEERVRARIRSAMTYPLIVLCLSLAVAGFLVTYVLPQFAAIYADMGVTLPATTRFMLAVSAAAGHSGGWMALSLLATVGAGWRWTRSDQGRRAIDHALLRLPALGPLLQFRAAARATRSLSGLLGSAVPVVTALELTCGAVGNSAMVDELLRVRSAVQKGQDLASSLRTSSHLPPMVAEYVAVGQESGTVPEMLARVARSLDDDVEQGVERLAAAIEPLMTTCLTLLVGFVVITVVSPIMNMWGQIK